jgi:hypothetical protein
LAYDERELFERCGQLLFPKIESPWQVTKKGYDPAPEFFDQAVIFDLVAAVHLINFKLVDKPRMPSAHAHLMAMIQQSRMCWERANAEQDDDHEWIPNADQQGVFQLQVSREVITGWHEVLDELEAILNGTRLVPYQRDFAFGVFGNVRTPDRGIGINLHRFFTEPADFDLILAIQGTGLEPYLEQGDLSTPEAWERLLRAFRGEFFGFAIWFN